MTDVTDAGSETLQERVGTVIFTTLAVLAVVVLVSNLVVHPWDQVAPSGRLLYFGLPLAAAVVFAAVPRLVPARQAANLGVSVVAVGIALLAVEVGITVADATPEPWMEGDTRSAGAVLRDLRAEGVEAYPAVLPRMFLGDAKLSTPTGPTLPLGGVRLATISLCNELGRPALFESDRYGFNNPDRVWDADVTAVLVGDSFTMGSCVGPSESIGGVLNAGTTETISLGMGNNGPLLELASLVEYGALVEPPWVFWIYFEGNDLADLEKESADALLRRYLERGFSQDLVARSSEVAAAVEAHITPSAPPALRPNPPILGVLKLARTRNRVRSAIQALRAGDGLDAEAEARATALLDTVLVRGKQEIAGWGGQGVFVYLPEWERYADRKDGRRLDERRASVLRIATGAGFDVVDLTPVFDAAPDAMVLFASRARSTHYGPEGYALVAEAIEGHIRDARASGRAGGA